MGDSIDGEAEKGNEGDARRGGDEAADTAALWRDLGARPRPPGFIMKLCQEVASPHPH